jgi:hypothetical protein
MKYSIHLLLLIGLMSFSVIAPCIARAEKPFQTTGNKDSLSAVNSIKGFLKWYKVNYKKVNRFVLVGSDKKGNYYVKKM